MHIYCVVGFLQADRNADPYNYLHCNFFFFVVKFFKRKNKIDSIHKNWDQFSKKEDLLWYWVHWKDAGNTQLREAV